MQYLIMITVFAPVMSLIFKYTQSKKWDGEPVILCNYVVAIAVSLFLCIKDSSFPLLLNALSGDIFVGMIGNLNGDVNNPGSAGIAIIFGVFTGILFLAGLLCMQWSIHQNGASLSSIVHNISFVITISLSALIWREIPSTVQLAGVAIAIVALTLASYTPGETQLKFRMSLLVYFIVSGLVQMAMKAFAVLADPGFRNVFLLIVFISAILIYIAVLFYQSMKGLKKIKWHRGVMIAGALFGVFNMMNSNFIQVTLRLLPVSIVYPTQGTGAMILVTIFSIIFFKEQVQKYGWVALVLCAISITLVNI